jgi:hypothetical protein
MARPITDYTGRSSQTFQRQFLNVPTRPFYAGTTRTDISIKGKQC